MFTHRYTEAELADRQFSKTIPPKWEVYYLLLARGRCFGYRRTPKCGGRWVARLRVTTGCGYREYNMSLGDDTRPANGQKVLTTLVSCSSAAGWLWHRQTTMLLVRSNYPWRYECHEPW